MCPFKPSSYDIGRSIIYFVLLQPKSDREVNYALAPFSSLMDLQKVLVCWLARWLLSSKSDDMVRSRRAAGGR